MKFLRRGMIGKKRQIVLHGDNVEQGVSDREGNDKF